MDRDKNWDRVQKAYDVLTKAEGEKAESACAGIQASYDKEVNDEFVVPFYVEKDGKPVATIQDGDSVIFFNFRPDRAREITRAFCDEGFTGFAREKKLDLTFVCFTDYDETIGNKLIAFKKEEIKNTFGEFLAAHHMTQARIAETEKYAHVTFFLNGGREEKFDGEERILVASPKVATYDLQPEMSAPEVAEKLVAALGEKKFDFICLNFANGDMVGHTGVYEAIVKAVKAVDKCVSEVVEAARANGYEVVMIADHGNADNAVNADGTPNTAHSLNPVPIVVVSDRVKSVRSGILADVAPTVLRLMGLEQPAEMTGKALVELK